MFHINKSMSIAIVTAFSLLAITPSCTKKTIKASVLPQASTPAAQQTPASPPARTSFETTEADSVAKTILQPVYFEYAKSDLRQDGLDRLTIIGRWLSDNPKVNILIEGNADERGSAKYNMGLGDNRAHQALSWLKTYGIDQHRIETTSYGKERPAIQNCMDEPCHAKNRRDEFKILKN